MTYFIKERVYVYIHQEFAMKLKLILLFCLQYLNAVYVTHPLPKYCIIQMQLIGH